MSYPGKSYNEHNLNALHMESICLICVLTIFRIQSRKEVEITSFWRPENCYTCCVQRAGSNVFKSFVGYTIRQTHVTFMVCFALSGSDQSLSHGFT